MIPPPACLAITLPTPTPVLLFTARISADNNQVYIVNTLAPSTAVYAACAPLIVGPGRKGEGSRFTAVGTDADLVRTASDFGSKVKAYAVASHRLPMPGEFPGGLTTAEKRWFVAGLSLLRRHLCQAPTSSAPHLQLCRRRLSSPQRSCTLVQRSGKIGTCASSPSCGVVALRQLGLHSW